MRRLILLCLLTVALLSLSGCYSTMDELYALPAAPEDYENLQKKINEVIDAGGEPTSPVSGDKIQSVQLQDLDGDGVQEAIAFFRMSDDTPLKIYIYRQVGEDYEQAAVIASSGTSINSIAYENLNDTPGLEIVVSWQISDKVNFLAAYSLNLQRQPGEVVELMRVDYTDFKLMDLDQDGQTELLTLQYQAEGGGRVDYYNFQEGALVLDSTAPLSSGAASVQERKSGALKGGLPALFITSPIPSDSENTYVTDIFAVRNGRLENITLDTKTGRSEETVRYFYNAVGCTDINGDQITEVPQPSELGEYKGSSLVTNFWLVAWRQFSLDGTATTLYTTYYNNQDGWYFVLPDHWLGNITLSRSDMPGGGERAVVFSYWKEGDVLHEPEPFLTIYKLTGTNRQQRAVLPGRFNLLPDGGGEEDTIYVALLESDGWDCGLDEAGVAGRFHLIPTSWTTG